VTESEVLAAVRSHSIADLHRVTAVVLETDGSFSVMGDAAPSDASSLRNVRQR
jgi:hypothetical protein